MTNTGISGFNATGQAKPTALVVSAPGTNRDRDAVAAFELAGATARVASLHHLASDPTVLDTAQIVVFAGGFSHADALGAGVVAGLHVRETLGPSLQAFVASGRPVLGVCNGFQILTRSGLLPGSLERNDHGRFVCKWVTLEAVGATACVWTAGLREPIQCPVAHGEGRYRADHSVIARHQALVYADATNPNGSDDATAGVTDASGLVLGMMPHPENHILARQHPRWTRGEATGLALGLFRGGVDHVIARG